MQDRIRKLYEYVMAGKMWPQTVTVEYDPEDILLSPVTMSAKRVKEYILGQNPRFENFSAFTGLLIFDGSVEGDVFTRKGHKNHGMLYDFAYCKPLHNLVTSEWQHSTADFSVVLGKGIKGMQEDIEKSKEKHTGVKEQEFLQGLNTVCEAIIGWAGKCSERVLECAKQENEPEYRENLEKLGMALKKVPYYPAVSFYEAVLTVYMCFSFVPDSLGLLDRYLYPFYEKNLADGTLTREQAGAYLQELFLMLQSRYKPDEGHFYRGGESHFAIGGYLANGEDGFNDLSKLIVESLIELPTYMPQISLRWTEKTPEEVFYFMMDCERKDKNKRIAFVNDEPKIRAFMENLKFSYEDAVRYTMVGCNEVAFPGGMYMGAADQNIVRSLETVFHKKSDLILNARTFDEFYAVYEKELENDIDEMLAYEDKFNLVRARDTNLVSSVFFNGCIEHAKSITEGGANIASAGLDFIGLVNVIDSLAVVKQFVFEEKLVTMAELVEALQNNWEGYEDIRILIRKKGQFFGNDDRISNEAAARFTESVYKILKDKESVFGYRYLVGNLIGYNQHHAWFGERTLATPDGRMNGQAFKFGLGQSDGYDRSGLSALLNAVAKCDANHILHGPTVTNITLDEKMVTEEANFEKTVKLFETYFRNGGIHFQLNYVSKEDLLAAKETPENYGNLRVRVSGFSDYFVNLNDDLQDDIIDRTSQRV